MPTNTTPTTRRFEIDDRVIIDTEINNVDFTIHEGSVGTVIDNQFGQYGIKLDKNNDGLDDWENVFYICDGDELDGPLLDHVRLLSDAIFNAQLDTHLDAVSWVVNLHAADKLWHFDDDPTDQINIDSGEATFTDEEAAKVAVLRNRAIELMDAAGIDIFDVALRLINEG